MACSVSLPADTLHPLGAKHTISLTTVGDARMQDRGNGSIMEGCLSCRPVSLRCDPNRTNPLVSSSHVRSTSNHNSSIRHVKIVKSAACRRYSPGHPGTKSGSPGSRPVGLRRHGRGFMMQEARRATWRLEACAKERVLRVAMFHMYFSRHQNVASAADEKCTSPNLPRDKAGKLCMT